jgi:hypothetical protein
MREVALIAYTQVSSLNAYQDRVPKKYFITTRGLGKVQATLQEMLSESVDMRAAAIADSDAARLTAEALGIGRFSVKPLLSDKDTELTANVQRGMLRKDKLPPEAASAADAILENPFEEPVWIAGRSTVAAISRVLGLTDYGLIPDFGERRTIQI